MILGCSTASAVASSDITARGSSAAKLLDLANGRFPKGICPAEEKLIEATSDGAETDCTQFAPPDNVIRGDFLAWLCTDPDASKSVTYHGISIAGAEITGEVNLAFAKILFPIRIRDTKFRESINFESSNVSSLELTCCKADRSVNLSHAVIAGDLICNGGHFVGTHDEVAIDTQGAHIKGFVFLRKDPDGDCEFIAEGGVDIANAKIDKNLECDGANFVGYEATPALNAENAQIGGSVFLHRTFSAEGEVRLTGAKIGGDLDCHGSQFVNNATGTAINASYAKILGSALLTQGTESNASFTACGGVDFSNATIGGNFECKGSLFLSYLSPNALNADRLEVKGSVSLANGFLACGRVLFRRATIGGDFNCIGGTFIGDGQSPALDADAVNIQGSASLRKDWDASNGFTAKGQVDLIGATIGGDLDCSGGQFLTSSQEPALNAQATKIARGVFLRDGTMTEGSIIFQYADVGGILELLDVRAAGKVTVDLQFAKVATFSNNQDYFSDYQSVYLNGFLFDRFGGTKSTTAEERLDWIHLHPRNIFSTQPYVQLAAVFHNMGLEDEAKKVLIAKNSDLAQKIPLCNIGEWIWYNFFGHFIGFGYRPWRAFWVSAGAILLGCLLFHRGYKRGLVTPTEEKAYAAFVESFAKSNGREVSDYYPKFNAFFYSLETFVPLLELGISDRWIPNANRKMQNANPKSGGQVGLAPAGTGQEPGAARKRSEPWPPKSGRWLRCYLWVHIIAGWVLTTLWLAGLTGLVKT